MCDVCYQEVKQRFATLAQQLGKEHTLLLDLLSALNIYSRFRDRYTKEKICEMFEIKGERGRALIEAAEWIISDAEKRRHGGEGQ